MEVKFVNNEGLEIVASTRGTNSNVGNIIDLSFFKQQEGKRKYLGNLSNFYGDFSNVSDLQEKVQQRLLNDPKFAGADEGILSFWID